MFEEMMQGIRLNVSNILSFIEIKSDVPNLNQKIDKFENKEKQCLEDIGNKKNFTKCNLSTYDSGKKYKRCCGKI